jgi:putative redox protein
MVVEKFCFEGHDGSELVGRLDRPEGVVRGTALLAHCFTCSKDLAAARRIAGRLAARGMAVLRFDFTGLGHSGGEFSNTNFSSNVEDLVLAAQELENRLGAPQLLVGHSLGGAAAVAAAVRLPSVRAVVTMGAPADPSHVAGVFAEKVPEIREKGEAEVELAGRSFTIRRQFLEDIEQTRLAEDLGKLGAALLVLHAPRDEIVGIDNAAALFGAARHPKSFVTLDDADHLLTREADAEYAAEVIVAWSARYLELAPEERPQAAPEGVVRVSEAGGQGFLQDITVDGRHSLLADEPEELGGTDRGPSPYQFLAAALGACTTMTLRMYASRKGLPLEAVTCDVTHDKCHREAAKEPGGAGGKIDVFRRTLHLRGELDPPTRERLLAIADKCPVHRTLHAEVRIETELGA